LVSPTALAEREEAIDKARDEILQNLEGMLGEPEQVNYVLDIFDEIMPVPTSGNTPTPGGDTEREAKDS
jgi:hypothetical protein